MARENIAPTKSSLLRVKEQLNLALEGHDLLDQKREILVHELLILMKEAKTLEESLAERVDSAYPTLEKALMTLGRNEAEKLAGSVVVGYQYRESSVGKAGLAFSSIGVDIPASEPRVSLSGGSAAADRTMVEFQELLALTVALATVGTQVARLARELKKTQRRVNALEKIVIPQMRETGHYIETVLEERDREAFFVGKLLKRRYRSGG